MNDELNDFFGSYDESELDYQENNPIGGPENMEGTPLGQYKSVILKRTVGNNTESTFTTNLPYTMNRNEALRHCNKQWPEFDSVELSFIKRKF